MARKNRIEKGEKSLDTYLGRMSAEEKRQMYMDMYGSWENVPENKRVEVEGMETEQRRRGGDLEAFQGVKMESIPSKGVVTAEKKPAITMQDDYENPAEGAESMGQYGTMIATAGQAFATTLNLVGTVIDGPEKETNYFADYANRTLEKIDEMKRFAGTTRKLKMADTLMAERGARAANRGTARGVGSLRALDIGTYIAGMGQRRAIASEFATDTAKVLGMEADVMLDQDAVRMGEETKRAERELQNRDAWKSNLSQNIMDIGSTAQNIGRQMNVEETEKMGWGIAGSSSKYLSPEQVDEYYEFKRKQKTYG